VVAVVFATYFVADHIGGSGFIAAYVAGNGFGRIIDRVDPSSEMLGEDLGSVLAMTSFLIFGAFILGPNLGAIAVSSVVYAILSLTFIRMIPVAIAMIGTHMQRPTIAYLGWFGPRGLASIIFAGVLIEDSGLDEATTIVGIVIVTVTLSVLLHGLTAPWGSNKYAAWYGRHSERIGEDEAAG
jgi:NhaP-type Na+/H+ or K+/H+ antiporter